MTDYVTLLGAEEVRSASCRMQSAADSMTRAADTISSAVDRLIAALEEDRFQRESFEAQKRRG